MGQGAPREDSFCLLLTALTAAVCHDAQTPLHSRVGTAAPSAASLSIDTSLLPPRAIASLVRHVSSSSQTHRRGRSRGRVGDSCRKLHWPQQQETKARIGAKVSRAHSGIRASSNQTEAQLYCFADPVSFCCASLFVLVVCIACFVVAASMPRMWTIVVLFR